jgi:acyl-CoA reductase-like NAD-dependent aldehyde dehydrogenase
MVETIRTISPVNHQVVFEGKGTSLEEASHIVKASKDAFLQWKKVPLVERSAIVQRGLALIQERKEQLGLELTTQMGRPIAYSVKEIETMQKRADYLLKTAEESLRAIPGEQEAGFRRWVKKEPVGPTLVVFAWNVSIGTLYGKTEQSDNTDALYLPVSISHHCQRPCSGAARGKFGGLEAITTDSARGATNRRDIQGRGLA